MNAHVKPDELDPSPHKSIFFWAAQSLRERYVRRRNDVAAKRYIRAAHECGLVIFPWHEVAGRHCVAFAGQELIGDDNFCEANARFAAHPASVLPEDRPKDLIYNALCADMGLDPDDPDLCTAVNTIMLERYYAR